MGNASFEQKLNELVRELTGSVDIQDDKRSRHTGKSTAGGGKAIDKGSTDLADSLDYLRICIKYQLLDLEATRRENDYLRKLLRDKDSG